MLAETGTVSLDLEGSWTLAARLGRGPGGMALLNA